MQFFSQHTELGSYLTEPYCTVEVPRLVLEAVGTLLYGRSPGVQSALYGHYRGVQVGSALLAARWLLWCHCYALPYLCCRSGEAVGFHHFSDVFISQFPAARGVGLSH